MNRILVLFLSLTLFLTNMVGQDQSRGLKLTTEPENTSGSTKLVVIGVSKYQNVQSLSYAHTDAQTFYNFMVSPTGGSVAPENAKVLLNEKASAANIFATLDWLLDATQEGETVVFYFAGHGDLESKTLSQRGFLLASDAPTAAYMAGGTIGVMYLQDYLTTLVQQNKARVILITDACHSGKLAGGLEGVANTATALQGQWENTIKILSSQPGELSQEGTKWNGGGGVFTYYLVKGLMGFADRNHDNKITVNEINIYLNDNVPNETQFTQNPAVSGNASQIIALVDSVEFNKIKSSESSVKIDNSMIAQRGDDDALRKMLDTAIFRQYQDFRYCIEHHYLIIPDSKYGCAWDIYQSLKGEKKAAKILSTMKMTLLSALQLTYQISFNCVVNNTLPPDTLPRQLVENELRHALMLIDSTHIIYNHLLSAYYLSRVPVENSNVDETWQINAEKAILAEPDNPIPHMFKGHYFRAVKKFDEAIAEYRNASSLAPTWFWPLRSIARIYSDRKEFETAAYYQWKCISSNPEFIYTYFDLGMIYKQMNKPDSVRIVVDMVDSVCTANKHVQGLRTIGEGYANVNILNDLDRALYFYEKALTFDPKDKFTLYDLSCLYSLKNQKAEALQYFESALKEGWTDFDHIQKDTDLDNIRNS
ncbi:MAG: caspase family protein, partial [Bacteroidetes bacterium]|nr:caspase family protein [Bacteroidota bacterium]